MLLTLACLTAALWIAHAARSLHGIARVPDLNQVVLPPADSPARVSVLVPARNEEQAIGHTLASLLASTGVALEIIAIDDRSTDGTAAAMHAAAACVPGTAHSLRVIQNRTLAPDWLGKPHALNLGLAQATAPWVLLTDGDGYFASQAIARAVYMAQQRGSDHLALIPTQIDKHPGEQAVMATLQAMAGFTVRFWQTENPRTRDAMGVGVFNLFRRTALDAVGGLASVRMAVVEDVLLAQKVKRAGLRSTTVCGLGQLRIHWIEGWFGVVRVLEKNAFAGTGFRLPLVLFAIAGMLVQILVPLLAIAAGGWALLAGLATYASIAIVFQANRRMNGADVRQAWLFAPALAVVCWAFVRSTAKTLRRGGIEWRGSFYPTAQLRPFCPHWW